MYPRKSTLYVETKKTIKALQITLAVMIAVLAAAFLFLTGENSQKGYALEQEKMKNEQLKSDNDSINAKINQETPASKLEENDLLSNMAPPEQKTFVTEEDNKVN